VDDPFADEIPRPDGRGRATLVEAAPGKRSEEPDRVVLRAVALPVACDDLLLAEPPGRALTLVAGELVDGRGKGFAALPGDGLAEGRVAGNLPEPHRLVRRSEDLESGDRKARAAHCEVPPNGPVIPQGNEVILHAGEPSVTVPGCTRRGGSTVPKGSTAPAA
jgi:hypothetical protein